MQLPAYLGIVRDAERHLADALTLLADRHSADADVRDVARLLARWSRAHVAKLAPFLARYGVRSMADPARLRGGLLQGTRVGGLGLVRDVHDLLTYGQYVRGAWTAVFQAAMELHDMELAGLCTEAAEATDRQLIWLETRLRLTAPQALTVPPSRGAELYASLPKVPTPAAWPDLAWAPLTGGLLVLVIGLLALAAGQPWLLPSLGPTAYLIAEMPASPMNRFYNVVAGHLLGVVAGILAVWATGAAVAPVTLETGVLAAPRVWAAALAIVLTLAACLALRASHAPAAATTLLVALGSLRTPGDVLGLALGAAVMAAVGVALRRLRLGRWPHRRATHAPSSAGPPAITAPVAPEFKKAA
jgi:hypothetical protein